jgi:hypothetical protein
MSTLVTGPQLLVEQLREVVVAEIISDRQGWPRAVICGCG